MLTLQCKCKPYVNVYRLQTSTQLIMCMQMAELHILVCALKITLPAL